jgi:probable HAF family extracellular repeat protein
MGSHLDALTGALVAYTGLVVGNIDSQAVVWNGTTPTYLDSLGGDYSQAQAINNAGQVVGYSTTVSPGAYHATLWNGTTPTDLGTLGGHSYAHDINDSGIIVGDSYTVEGVAHAFLWDGTSLTDLNSFLDSNTVEAGWVLAHAYGINNQGSIIGLATNTTVGIERAYLLTPVDGDGDLIPDISDNCILISNPDQLDTDRDGYGNICDADFNNDGIVGPFDLSSFRAAYGKTTYPDQDLNGDGVVGPFDLSAFRSYYGKPPGPSCCGITLP